jgi:hypothetical protein
MKKDILWCYFSEYTVEIYHLAFKFCNFLSGPHAQILK